MAISNHSFRIVNQKGVIINESNDDGENRAGEWILEPLMVRIFYKHSNSNRSVVFSS